MPHLSLPGLWAVGLLIVIFMGGIGSGYTYISTSGQLAGGFVGLVKEVPGPFLAAYRAATDYAEEEQGPRRPRDRRDNGLD